MHLITTPNIEDPDAFYQALLEAHAELTDSQSQALNAQLVLILANHIGDRATLQAALDLARADFDAP